MLANSGNVLLMPPVNHQAIRARRDELDLSNGQLAALANIPYPSLSNIVSGVDDPSMRRVHCLSRALGVPVDDLLAKPQGDPSQPPEQPKRPQSPPKRQDTEGGRKGPKRVAGSVAA